MKYPHIYVNENSDKNIDSEFRDMMNNLIAEIEEFPCSDVFEKIRQSISIAWRLKNLGLDNESEEVLSLAIEDFDEIRGEELLECPWCGERWDIESEFSYCPYDGRSLEFIHKNEHQLRKEGWLCTSINCGG